MNKNCVGADSKSIKTMIIFELALTGPRNDIFSFCLEKKRNFSHSISHSINLYFPFFIDLKRNIIIFQIAD